MNLSVYWHDQPLCPQSCCRSDSTPARAVLIVFIAEKLA